MSDKNPTFVRESRWRDEYEQEKEEVTLNDIQGNSGEIRFRRSKKRSKIKGLIKGVVLVLVASLSGAVAGAYVVEKKYSDNRTSSAYPDQFTSQGPVYSTVGVLPKNVYSNAAEIVGPAVVGISNDAQNFLGSTLNQFMGSGIIFTTDGYIVTNYHVIEGADKISVKLASGDSKPVNARLIGFDKTSDLAVIKIDLKGLPIVRFGDSSKTKVGDIAIAIGNPLGEEYAGSVTAGIISAINRRIEILNPFTKETTVYNVFQTDAAINPGNSGGPLCNEYGDVIGINSLKMGIRENAEGMGFAISINEVNDVITAILTEGRVKRPTMGINGATMKDNKGVYVLEVYFGSGAYDSGILPTDIVTQIDGTKIIKTEDLNALIEKHKIGDIITCKILRDEKTRDFKVTLKEK